MKKILLQPPQISLPVRNEPCEVSYIAKYQAGFCLIKRLWLFNNFKEVAKKPPGNDKSDVIRSAHGQSGTTY
jgi:hypothetical protein